MQSRMAPMKRVKTVVGYTIATILLIAAFGFFGAPEYCSGRVDTDGYAVYDSNDKWVMDCTPWLRYLLFGHHT